MSYHGLGFSFINESVHKAEVSSGKMPAGLSPEYLKSYPVASAAYQKQVTASGPVADQCNQSAQPVICNYAKTVKNANGMTPAFLGRASKQSDWDAWRKWTPPGEAPMEQSPSGESAVVLDEGVPDVVFFGGIAAALALVGLGLWYSTK
jgi:hypothetical protein